MYDPTTLRTFFNHSTAQATAAATTATTTATTMAAAPSANDVLKSRDDMAKYFKMRKLGLPDGPIRQKMMTDSVAAQDVAAFFGDVLVATTDGSGGGGEGSGGETGGGGALRKTLAKYFKMKKMGLPDGAIRQKMMADGVDALNVSMFFGEATERREAPSNVPKIDLSVLKAKQTARREEMKGNKTGPMGKYFKMQTMGIPLVS